MNSHPSRRDFLKTAALAGLGGAAATPALGQPAAGTAANITLPSGIVIPADDTTTRPRPTGQKPVHDLTTQPLEKVRVGVIGLNRGLAHVKACLNIDFCDVVAVCDLRDDRAQAAAHECEQTRGKRPAVYSGTEHIWEKMAARDDLDAIYMATPWVWHVPMALGVMKQGKHAFVEKCPAACRRSRTAGPWWTRANKPNATACCSRIAVTAKTKCSS